MARDMELIKFDEKVRVLRKTNEIDEYNEVVPDKEVYNGKCRYQQGVKSNAGFSVETCLLFIPATLPLKRNDSVKIELPDYDLKLDGMIDQIRFIKFPLTGERVMRIELKQVVEPAPSEDEDEEE